jgi:ribosomal protein L11 methyltransferase
MAHALRLGGHVILSGILNEQADEVFAVYVAGGFNPVRREEIVDWTTLMLVRSA